MENGKISGISIELLNYIAKREGWNITYKFGTLKDLLEDLKEGKIDLLTSVAYSPERAKYAYFSREPVYLNWADICQRKDENFNDIFSLRGKTIGVMSGDVYYTGPNNVRELFEKFEIPVKFMEFPDYPSVLRAVKDGKVDAGVVTRLYVDLYAKKYDVKGTSIIFDPVKIVFAASKKNPALLNVLRKIDIDLKEMKSDPSSKYHQIINKYLNYNVEFLGMPPWLKSLLIYALISLSAIVFSLIYTNKLLKRKVEKATIKLVERNKELETFNEKLKKAQANLQKSMQMENTIRKKYSEILKLLSSQSDLLKDNEEIFMGKVLSTAILVLEGDYGSVSKKENGKWSFVSAVGHNKDALNALFLDAKYMFNPDEVTIVDISKYNEQKFPPQVSEVFRKNAKPIKQSLFIPLSIGKTWDGNMCVDLAKDSDKSFSAKDLEVAKAFQEVAKAFLSIKLNSDLFKNAYIEFARRLAAIAESYDQTTGDHILRVGEIAALIAEKMHMPTKFVNEIREFAPLHDIGKILIAKEILQKPGKLNPNEWEEMKKHTIYAEKILNVDYFEMALKIAMYHHENYDGTGYPRGFRGEDIPLEAQIVHVVDVYDALRSHRPYKKAFSHEEALRIISQGDARVSPKHFHPQVLKVFLENVEEIKEIFEKMNDND